MYPSTPKLTAGVCPFNRRMRRWQKGARPSADESAKWPPQRRLSGKLSLERLAPKEAAKQEDSGLTAGLECGLHSVLIMRFRNVGT